MSIFSPQKVRIVTAAALFDGHDAAINIMRRIMQSKGAEIIHLGHNRSVLEIVECAIEEDANGIAITSYQGGHVEFFKYMKDLLNENGCGHIKIFGGGGGTILPSEIDELHAYGITKIYSPDDGRNMGLEGMIEDVIQQSASVIAQLHTPTAVAEGKIFALNEKRDIISIAKAISLAENGKDYSSWSAQLKQNNANKSAVVLGITGTGGAGKSSVTDEIVRRFLHTYTNKTIAVISVDPSKKKTGGALLGDRIRMNAISSPRAYMRSLATRDDNTALSAYVKDAIQICKDAGFDFIILESAGVGQSDASILDFVAVSMYVMTPEYGAASQLEKINMLDYADVICINKFDKAGALDALHDVRKQYKRNHGLWTAKDEELPVVGTIAAQFNDTGVNELFERLMIKIADKCGVQFSDNTSQYTHNKDTTSQSMIIPPKRVRYLAEIADTITSYNQWAQKQSEIATKLYQLNGVIKMMDESN
jgi:methylmalonyl-CoA mutase